MAWLDIVALGGLGEIGRNCLLLEQADGTLMVDCGVSFPFDDYGVSIVHPRFDRATKGRALSAVVLTHGHEDHIGALGYLVTQLRRSRGGTALLSADGLDRPLPIYGPRHALMLAEHRLEEAGVLADVTLIPIAPGERTMIGPFGVEPIRVTHSIPDAVALSIDTAVGRVVHSGDFKLDPAPGDGQVTDEARLAAIGKEGVALAMCDSTNILSAGHSGSEQGVAEALDDHIADAPRRVVVGCFASNVHRLRAIGAAAQKHGRKLCLLGRSVRHHAEVGRKLGMLAWRSDMVLHPDVAADRPHRELLYIAAGTQGEPRGALRRLASVTHRDLHLAAGDRVILSSRIIPGNERKVFSMIDDLLGLGVELRSRITHPELHVSGHAYRDEQRRMLELLSPSAFIPLHGTRLHLAAHADLATRLGVPEVLQLLDGQVARLDKHGLRVRASTVVGKVSVAGGREIGEEILRQRRQLGREGVVFVALFDAGEGLDVAISARGIDADAEEIADAARAAKKALNSKASRSNRQKAREAVRLAVRHRLTDLLEHKPPVDVILVGF